ncbi:MAG: hypothetical protein DRQ57_01980 [Gammaproteobacteria bacterium]|nr:MAG: hypothetical protein DRQ57_01980 [Gammaproteobacteria bacterium]
MINPISAKVLETLINQALHCDPSSLEALGQLSGKIIRLELTDLDLNYTLFPDEQGIIIFSDYEGEVDVQITGAPFTLLRLLLQRGTQLSNEPDITLNGEINLAQQGLLIFQGLNIDWETQFTKWFGSQFAHNLSTALLQCQDYADGQFNTLQRKLSEHLQEKTRHLPRRTEINSLSNAINTLRDDLERLEKRVEVLTTANQ